MNVQLANTYNPSKNYRVASWFASPKFDGVRAIFIPHCGFFTRNNKPIAGFKHMAEILERICTERGLLFVDGELVLKGSSFQASQSVILSAEHQRKSDVEYHVFAVGGVFPDTAHMLNALSSCFGTFSVCENQRAEIGTEEISGLYVSIHGLG